MLLQSAGFEMRDFRDEWHFLDIHFASPQRDLTPILAADAADQRCSPNLSTDRKQAHHHEHPPRREVRCLIKQQQKIKIAMVKIIIFGMTPKTIDPYFCSLNCASLIIKTFISRSKALKAKAFWIKKRFSATGFAQGVCKILVATELLQAWAAPLELEPI